jgi:hypothetical protein
MKRATGRPDAASLAARMTVRLLVLAAMIPACDHYDVCDTPDPTVLAAAPQRLSETGIDGADVIAYEPRFELWSDGAEKQRWIRIPPGADIDRTDMDDWRFPVGTRLWKQFSRDGVPIETRMLEKIAPADDAWLMVAYQWDEDGGDATIVPDGVANARGTTHDVPSATQCRGCHDGRHSRVLGYSAIQLDTSLMLPGTEIDKAALGYLHANCSHCHNTARPARTGSRCYDPEHDFDFRLLTTQLATVEGTAVYRTAVGNVIQPGSPEHSHLVHLVSGRAGTRMPPLGTEVVDSAAVVLLERWIQALR